MMKNKNPYILGLDVGTNSVGWAVVDCEIEEPEELEHKGIYAGYKPVSLRSLNSRIFLGMMNEKNVPKNQKRREARGARNRRAYYKKRRENLVEILIENGLLPDNFQKEPEKTLNEIDRCYAERKVGEDWSKTWTVTEKAYCSPYAMRNFAIEEKLEPHEFGRLLLHLQRRRGYFSNRGAKYIELIKSLRLDAPQDDVNEMSAEDKKETGPVIAAIDKLSNVLEGRTLGQFIWQQAQEKQVVPQRITLFEFEKPRQKKGETVIEQLYFRAGREMYEKEFEAIWQKQNTFYKLSDDVREAIEHTIFHQRPLNLQKGTVGNCNIYPNKKRTALARLEFQEFRILQVINNLKVSGKRLDAEQRQKVLSLVNEPNNLDAKGRMPWGKVAKGLGIKTKDLNYGDSGESPGLVGNRTAQAIIRSIGVDKWQGLGKEKQSQLVEDLLTIHNKKALYDRLVADWKFTPYQNGGELGKGALGLAMNEELEDGYGKHSLKAVNALLPHLRDGMDYYSAVEAIGKRDSITRTVEATEADCLLEVDDIPNIANPVVQKALYEIRRVMNAIVKRYGKPAIIRMELASEMKSSKKHRGKTESQQNENRKRNEEAEKEIIKHFRSDNSPVKLETVRGSVRRVSLDDRDKYKMWKYEQGEKCPYCQQLIGFNELFSGKAEIEHILPYTGFRQNYMNTLVSCRGCNQEKGQRTPYETWGSDVAVWEKIQEFAKENYRQSLVPKQRNILKKEHDLEGVEEFVKRQLNDTRYIASAAKKMLEKYGVPIDVNNGAATGVLRRRLGLNDVLPRSPDAGAYNIVEDPDTGKDVDTNTGEILQYSAKKAKKTRQDHRHHAVDAFVVAMTDRAMLRSMVVVHKNEQDNKDPWRQKTRDDWIRERRLQLPTSWKDGENLTLVLSRKLNATVVSHMANRKIWGPLHKETRYGKSHFSQVLNLDCLRKIKGKEVKVIGNHILKKARELAEAEVNGDQDWIADELLRDTLLQWSNSMLDQPIGERKLPLYKDKELKEIAYQTPCMTTRKELRKPDGLEFLSKLSEEWKPGKGTWIAEKSIHDALYKWLAYNDLVGKKAKDIAAGLKQSPPRLPNKSGQTVPVNRVRVARPMSDSYVKISGSYVETGSNHHFVLFHNGKEGKERRRKVHLVTMQEAARRASVGEPVINRTPQLEWEDEWHFELSLCVNDMVCCQDMNIFDDEKRFAPEHKETPYFRVQNMSSSGDNNIDLQLRHHSISGTDSNWGLWRISSLKEIACTKVNIGNLGLLLHDS